MINKFMIAAAIAVAPMASAAYADTLTFNSDPSVTFNYGAGNNYIPANSAVLTTTDPASQIAGRAHIYQVAASPSSPTGVYSFALGSNVSFDYSFSNLLTGQIQLINLLTGQTYDSGSFTLGNSLLQDSQRLNFAFIAGPLGYDALVNDTYQVNLIGTNSAGSHMNTFFSQLGNGGAVPEPATWAMMLLGFGGIGIAVRRSAKQGKLALKQIA